MRLRFLILLALLVTVVGALVVRAQAATPPFTTANKWAWNVPTEVTTAAEAQTLGALLNLDGTTTALTNVVCAGTTAITCTAPLTAAQVPVLNKYGRHTATLALVASGVVGASSSPFTQTVPLGAPTGISIQ